MIKAKDLLLEKKKCATLYNDMTMDKAISLIGKNRFQTVPVLERGSDRYLYSLSEGDLLFKIKELGLPYPDCSDMPIAGVTIERLCLAVKLDAEISDIYDLIVNQSFVPVIDDKGVFKGIITRRKVIDYLLEQVESPKE